MSRGAPRILANRYELQHVAGRGGMAVVWRAVMRYGQIEHPVAVKQILVDIARDPTIVSLFVEEARVGKQLRHPNIVQVIDFGTDEEHGYYLVLEWVEGLDLLEYMRSFHETRVHVPWQAVVAVAQQALRGLAAAHEHIDANGRRRPVIHRDLSPSNLLVGINGIVKIADFGLSRATDRATMTFPNIIKGKVSYLAPELAAGKKANERSDMFTLGVTLWECMAARKLFSGHTNYEVIQAIQNWQIPPLEVLRPDAPRELVEAITRSIARKPQDRFLSAREMLVEMEGVARVMREPSGPEALGPSVIAAKARLNALDNNSEISLHDSTEDSFELSVELEVDFPSSPSATRAAFRKELSEPFEEYIEEMPTLPRRKVGQPPASRLAPRPAPKKLPPKGGGAKR